MSVHVFHSEQYHTTLGPHVPALTTAGGGTVNMTAVDAAGRGASGECITASGTPVLGPF